MLCQTLFLDGMDDTWKSMFEYINIYIYICDIKLSQKDDVIPVCFRQHSDGMRYLGDIRTECPFLAV